MQKNDTDTPTQDDELKALFSNFNPLMSSDKRFITRLQRRLDTIDRLNHEMVTMRRRNRRAVILATLAGFVAGVLTCLLLPSLTSLIIKPDLQWSFLSLISPESSAVLWLLPAGAALLASLGVYSLTSKAAY